MVMVVTSTTIATSATDSSSTDTLVTVNHHSNKFNPIAPAREKSLESSEFGSKKSKDANSNDEVPEGDDANYGSMVDQPLASNNSNSSCQGLNLSSLMRRSNDINNNNNNNNNNKSILASILSVQWALDVGLSRSLPQVMLDRTEAFLNTPRRCFEEKKPEQERLLYVSQAEVAHATPNQCNVMVSDRATTCHILALNSRLSMPRTKATTTAATTTNVATAVTTTSATTTTTAAGTKRCRRSRRCLSKSFTTTTTTTTATTSSSGASTPLASMTHLDSPSYESCIRAMIQQHKRHHHIHHHHHHHSNETTTTNSNCHHNKMDMDIHICGGFEDSGGLSRAISNWLVLLLLKLAAEETNTINMTLQTCAMTCLNNGTTTTTTTQPRVSPSHQRRRHDDNDDDNRVDDETTELCSFPRGRGLALNVHTGQVYLAHVVDMESLAGPLLPLRGARLWANAKQPQQLQHPRLSVIHTNSSCCRNHFVIEPFVFGPFDDLDWLLSLPDDELLEQTSTSPQLEEEDYCRFIRQSLLVMRDWNCHSLFGTNCDLPLKFQRGVAAIGNNNTQDPSASATTTTTTTLTVNAATASHNNVWTWIPHSRRRKTVSKTHSNDTDE